MYPWVHLAVGLFNFHAELTCLSLYFFFSEYILTYYAGLYVIAYIHKYIHLFSHACLFICGFTDLCMYLLILWPGVGGAVMWEEKGLVM